MTEVMQLFARGLRSTKISRLERINEKDSAKIWDEFIWQL
jgi:hypothetical protein